jgi:hypothetical protein
MSPPEVEELKVYDVDGRKFLHAPAGRGEELRLHLASHNIRSAVSPLAVGGFDRLELEADADPAVVQAVLDHWER